MFKKLFVLLLFVFCFVNVKADSLTPEIAALAQAGVKSIYSLDFNEADRNINAILEQNPGYPGGHNALQAFLKANKRYDGLAQEYGANGRVITSFLIDSLGYISDIKVHRCLLKYDTLRLNRETQEMQQQVKAQITTQLGEESKRLVSLMPRWTPGKMYGKSRNVRYTMPIQFP